MKINSNLIQSTSVCYFGYTLHWILKDFEYGGHNKNSLGFSLPVPFCFAIFTLMYKVQLETTSEMEVN